MNVTRPVALAAFAAALVACDEGPASRPARDAAPADLGEPDGPLPADAAPGRDARPADAEADADADVDAGLADATADVGSWPYERLKVEVRVDGAPTAGVLVMQGGARPTWRTGPDGKVVLPLDYDVPGQVWIVASHPEARVGAVEVFEGMRLPVVIPLSRFDTGDNPAYRFQDPGEPGRRETTAQCGHCHQTLNDDWYASPHRTSASNAHVHDLYAGAAAIDDADACRAAGGRWREGRMPGKDGVEPRCYLGDGVLPLLNAACAEGPCLAPAATGGCADCHAPGIDGALGGRDLLEARDHAFDYGVHCDVCHRVEGVVMDAEPGAAGRLRLLRPTEPAPISLGAGGFRPLTFGPDHDSPNPRMGSVQRDHFRSGEMCAGCHQQDQPVLVPGAAIDRARWPDGRLPVHSTWAEWRAGVLADAVRCPDCHMPPAAAVANAADLQLFPLAEVGVQGGWYRPPGAVRHHSFVGPRTPGSGMLEHAAAVFVEKAVQADRVEARVTVRNAGAGHAIPTGEPLRALLLKVEAWCGDVPLAPVGGDALPGWAGALARRARGEDWTRWPEARPGDVVRVVRRPGGFHAYDGFGRFAGDALPPAEKGLPVELVAGEARVVSAEQGRVTFDRPLPEGDAAWLVRPDDAGPAQLAGAPGFAFARVMADAEGREMVPHFLAVDVTADNRLLPQQRWTSTHAFAPCAEPAVRATLLYRPFPWWLARERRWDAPDRPMAEVRR